MTARKAGELAAGGVFVTLRRLRDQWVLLVFAASVLFWARDVYDRFIDLPDRVAELRAAVDELSSGVGRLEAGQEGAVIGDRSAALASPGSGHAIEDGRPGDVVMVRFAPVFWERSGCGDAQPAVFMVDAGGKWYPVETDLVEGPLNEESRELAFGVKIHPRMDVGRAELLVQLTRECGSRNVDASLRLPFRVLPN